MLQKILAAFNRTVRLKKQQKLIRQQQQQKRQQHEVSDTLEEEETIGQKASTLDTSNSSTSSSLSDSVKPLIQSIVASKINGNNGKTTVGSLFNKVTHEVKEKEQNGRGGERLKKEEKTSEELRRSKRNQASNNSLILVQDAPAAKPESVIKNSADKLKMSVADESLELSAIDFDHAKPADGDISTLAVQSAPLDSINVTSGEGDQFSGFSLLKGSDMSALCNIASSSKSGNIEEKIKKQAQVKDAVKERSGKSDTFDDSTCVTPSKGLNEVTKFAEGSKERNAKLISEHEANSHKISLETCKADVETSIEKKADETSIEKKADETSIEKKADETSIEKKAEETSIEKKAEETSIEKMAHETSIKKKADETSIEKKADETSIEKKADETSIKKKADETSIKKKAEETSIEKKAQETSTKKKSDETSNEKKAEETSIEKMAEETSIENMTQGSSIEKKAVETSIEKKVDETSIEKKAEETSIKKMAQETSIEKLSLGKSTGISQEPPLETNSKVPIIASESNVSTAATKLNADTKREIVTKNTDGKVSINETPHHREDNELSSVSSATTGQAVPSQVPAISVSGETISSSENMLECTTPVLSKKKTRTMPVTSTPVMSEDSSAPVSSNLRRKSARHEATSTFSTPAKNSKFAKANEVSVQPATSPEVSVQPKPSSSVECDNSSAIDNSSVTATAKDISPATPMDESEVLLSKKQEGDVALQITDKSSNVLSKLPKKKESKQDNEGGGTKPESKKSKRLKKSKSEWIVKPNPPSTPQKDESLPVSRDLVESSSKDFPKPASPEKKLKMMRRLSSYNLTEKMAIASDGEPDSGVRRTRRGSCRTPQNGAKHHEESKMVQAIANDDVRNIPEKLPSAIADEASTSNDILDVKSIQEEREDKDPPTNSVGQAKPVKRSSSIPKLAANNVKVSTVGTVEASANSVDLQTPQPSSGLTNKKQRNENGSQSLISSDIKLNKLKTLPHHKIKSPKQQQATDPVRGSLPSDSDDVNRARNKKRLRSLSPGVASANTNQRSAAKVQKVGNIRQQSNGARDVNGDRDVSVDKENLSNRDEVATSISGDALVMQAADLLQKTNTALNQTPKMIRNALKNVTKSPLFMDEIHKRMNQVQKMVSQLEEVHTALHKSDRKQNDGKKSAPQKSAPQTSSVEPSKQPPLVTTDQSSQTIVASMSSKATQTSPSAEDNKKTANPASVVVHLPTRNLLPSQANAEPEEPVYQRCVECLRNGIFNVTSCVFCDTCEVALCVFPCFRAYHSFARR